MDFSVSALLDALRRFADTDRLLNLHLGPGPDVPQSLLVVQLKGREALSECYAFDVELRTPDTTIRATQLLGCHIGVAMKSGVAEERWFNGVVTRVVPSRGDTELARFDLTVQPHFALLGIGRVARTYQDLTVPAIIEAELKRWQADIPDLLWRFDLFSEYPTRSYTVFHNETALAAIERLAAEEGIAYYFEHLPAEGDAKIGLQRLVFFDHATQLPANPQPVIRLHRAGVTETDPTIDQWAPEQRIAPGSAALQTWEYKGVRNLQATCAARTNEGPAARLNRALEDYAPLAQYYADPRDLDRYARLRMEAHEAHAQPVRGASNVPSAQTGTCFAVAEYFAADPNKDQFIFTAVEHEARNNLPKEWPGDRTDWDLREAGYRNHFSAARADLPWRPAYDATRHAKPTAPGPQPAIVVGPQEGVVHTDQYGRILVRFPWDPEGTSTCWVRVVTPLAGEGFGHISLPRVGQEVLVQYIQNDIDRPIVIGCVYDGRRLPPRFSHFGDWPENAALSGYKSAEYGAGRYNQWIADDTQGEISFKAQSEHGFSQLNLGYLTSPRIRGKADARGEGAELRSDRAVAVRGAQGVLISAEAQTKAEGPQLARSSLQAELAAAGAMIEQTAQLADTHGAGDTDAAVFCETRSKVDDWAQGTNVAKDAGSVQAKRPIVAVSGPAGVALASPESVAAASGGNVDLVSAKHTQVHAGRSLRLRALEAIGLFAHQLGMKLIAAAGKVEVQAHADNIELTTAKRLVLTAADEIVLQAPKITFHTQGAQACWGEGSITEQTLGAYTIHAANFSFGGAGGGSFTPPTFPQSQLKTDEQFVIRKRGSGAPAAKRRYRIELDDGSVIEGTTDDAGRTTLGTGEALRIADITLLND